MSRSLGLGSGVLSFGGLHICCCEGFSLLLLFDVFVVLCILFLPLVLLKIDSVPPFPVLFWQSLFLLCIVLSVTSPFLLCLICSRCISWLILLIITRCIFIVWVSPCLLLCPLSWCVCFLNPCFPLFCFPALALYSCMLFIIAGNSIKDAFWICSCIPSPHSACYTHSLESCFRIIESY